MRAREYIIWCTTDLIMIYWYTYILPMFGSHLTMRYQFYLCPWKTMEIVILFPKKKNKKNVLLLICLSVIKRTFSMLIASSAAFCFVFQCSPGNRNPTIAPDNANKITIKTPLITLITIDLVLSSFGTVLSMGHVSGQSTHAQCVEF